VMAGGMGLIVTWLVHDVNASQPIALPARAPFRMA
jgi:hypothetical protein